MGGVHAGLRAVLGDFGAFSRGLTPGFGLRGYQLEAAGPIIESVLQRKAGQFALVFARQAGKDELIVQLVAYLLTLHSARGGSVVGRAGRSGRSRRCRGGGCRIGWRRTR